MSTLTLNCSPMTAVVLENVSMYEVIWLEKLTHGCQNGFLKIALPSPGGLVQTSAAAHGWGLLEDSFPSLKRPGLDCKEENACKCFKANRKCAFSGLTLKGRDFSTLGLKNVHLPEGVRCSCRGRCRRREKWKKTDNKQRMYSAVIHKVESTTKLIATV